MAYDPIQREPETSGWGLAPGASDQNTERMLGAGYGSQYAGASPTSGIYESRMAQIRGAYAAKKAKEELAAEEAARAQEYGLRRQEYALSAQKYSSDVAARNEEYAQRLKEYGEGQAWKSRQYEDEKSWKIKEYALRMKEYQDRLAEEKAARKWEREKWNWAKNQSGSSSGSSPRSSGAGGSYSTAGAGGGNIGNAWTPSWYSKQVAAAKKKYETDQYLNPGDKKVNYWEREYRNA